MRFELAIFFLVNMRITYQATGDDGGCVCIDDGGCVRIYSACIHRYTKIKNEIYTLMRIYVKKDTIADGRVLQAAYCCVVYLYIMCMDYSCTYVIVSYILLVHIPVHVSCTWYI